MIPDPTILVWDLRTPSEAGIWCDGRINPIDLISSEIFLEWCSPSGFPLFAPMLGIWWVAFSGGTGVLGCFGFRCFLRNRSILMWGERGKYSAQPYYTISFNTAGHCRLVHACHRCLFINPTRSLHGFRATRLRLSNSSIEYTPCNWSTRDKGGSRHGEYKGERSGEQDIKAMIQEMK